jgi:hypothetical protein
MRIHTGEYDFSCSLCDYKAMQKKYLERHMKVHRIAESDTVSGPQEPPGDLQGVGS